MIPRLTVVVPAHNAGAALTSTVRRTVEVADAIYPGSADVIVVDDGSTDGSIDALRSSLAADPASFSRVTVLVHEQRRGKGAALRTGFLATQAEWVGFCDGDGDIDPGVFDDLAEAAGIGPHPAVTGPPDVVCAVKTAAAELPLLRKLASEAFKVFRRIVLPLGIEDSQTGAKLFAGEALREVLPELSETGFAFDLEALAALRAAGHGRFTTVVVLARRVSSSSLTLRSAMQLAWATVRVALHYRLGIGRSRRVEPAGTPPDSPDPPEYGGSPHG